MVNTTQTDTQVRTGEVVDQNDLSWRWVSRQVNPMLQNNSPLLAYILIGGGFVAGLMFLRLGWLLGVAAGLYLLYLALQRYQQTRQISTWLAAVGGLVLVGAIISALGLTLPILALTLFLAGGALLFRQYRGRLGWLARISNHR